MAEYKLKWLLREVRILLTEALSTHKYKWLPADCQRNLQRIFQAYL